jgi:hypothetical protein
MTDKPQKPRKPYQSLEGWALGILIEEHAIHQCDHHGYMRDRADPHALNRARARAERERFTKYSKTERSAAIDSIMMSIGDSCPEC